MPKSSENLSMENYRGTRDFFPQDQRVRQWLFHKWRNTLSQFGYEEYGGPILEPLELYASKSSEEIVSTQLYQFLDRGGRNVAIRPEMTPTLARMVAKKGSGIARPIRWFSIPTCMRYERPQRGRLREFDQLNVDVFGGEPFDEDIEIILTATHLMLDIGASCNDFEVLVNHRGLVNVFLQEILGISKESNGPVLTLLDKKDKLSEEAFSEQGKSLGLNSQCLASLLAFTEGDMSILPPGLKEWQDVQDRIDLLKKLVPDLKIRFAPEIMRGFLYYTGLVFEIYDIAPDNRRALFGGGRYDNLVEAFGVSPLSGIGYGMSDVSMLNFMETHGLVPDLKKPVDVAVLRFGPQDRQSALVLGQKLRQVGLNVETPLLSSKFGKQIEYASRVGAVAAVFQGEDELRNQQFAVKWLQTGEQALLSDEPHSFTAIAEKIIDLKSKHSQ